MDIIILSTVLFIALAILFYLPTKKIGKAIGYTILVYLIIQVIFGFILYFDLMQLKDRFPTEEKTILLNHEGNFISGFNAKDMENPEEIDFFTNEQMIRFKGKSNQEVLGNSYKLIVIKSGIFQNINKIEYSGQTFSKEEMLSILESDNAISDLANKFIEEGLEGNKEELIFQLKTQLEIEDDAQLKGLIFALLFSQSLQNDPIILIKGLQENKIIIYPETATFILIKLVPDYFMAFMITTIQERLSQII